jgi:lysozyme
MKTPRLLPVFLTVSALSLAGIAAHEGYRADAYDDGVGVQTLGFGTTAGVKPGDRITPERAVLRLAQDADRIGREIGACIGPVPLTQYEFNAYTSLAYNIGSSAFCRSTLVKRLKQTPPDYDAACREILRWDKAGGRVMAGLTKRRLDEYRVCVGRGA